MAMSHDFEVFVQNDKITREDWRKLILKIQTYEGNFVVEVRFETNNVEFYIYSQKDLSSLGDKLEGFIVKPIDRGMVKKPEFQKHINFKLSSNKNILEIREKEQIKNQRTISNVFIRFKRIVKANVHFVTILLSDSKNNRYYSSYFSLLNPLLSFDFDFNSNIKITKKSVPLFLKIDEATKLFTQDYKNDLLEVVGFPQFSTPTYFPLRNFEFGMHSLVVGQTGVGKTKFIELFVKNIAKYSPSEYVIVTIDPHSQLYSQFLNINENKVNFDFIKNSCELFPAFSEPKIATELTILLFKTLLKDQFNAKMERALKYALYVLFLRNNMSLDALKKFLTSLEFRRQILESLGGDYDYLIQFFGTEFVEFQTKFYEVSIMPILVLIDELSFIPAFFNNKTTNNLESALKENFSVTFSLNRIFLGEKATRLIAGLIIQQLFLIAQKGGINKKIILIIDEVSTVENEGLVNILSESRKFGLSLFLSQQYLTQITPNLLKGILSNVYNYFVFKVSDEDAKIIVKNLDISFPDEILVREKSKGLEDEDLKRNLLVTLNPRECLVRAFANGKFFPCFKAKTIDVN